MLQDDIPGGNVSGRWVWCPVGWKVVPTMGDKSWLGDSGSVPTISEWEKAVRNAPEAPSGWRKGVPPPPVEPANNWVVWHNGNYWAWCPDSEMWYAPWPEPPEAEYRGTQP